MQVRVRKENQTTQQQCVCFVANSEKWQLNATRSIVVMPSNNYFRMSEVRGGYSSISGLTVEPAWIEPGSQVAFVPNAIPESVPNTLVLFDGHGTKPTNIRYCEYKEWEEWITAWTRWRESKTSSSPENVTGNTCFHDARRHTRSYSNGNRLTEGEADALSRFEGTTLEIKETRNGTVEVIKTSKFFCFRDVLSFGVTNWKCYNFGDQKSFYDGNSRKCFYYVIKRDLTVHAVMYQELSDTNGCLTGEKKIFISKGEVGFFEEWETLLHLDFEEQIQVPVHDCDDDEFVEVRE